MPVRAEIIPYEPDTVSTGEGIVSSENTLVFLPHSHLIIYKAHRQPPMTEDLHGYFTDTGCVRCADLLAPERNITDFAILNRCKGSFTYIETALEVYIPFKGTRLAKNGHSYASEKTWIFLLSHP